MTQQNCTALGQKTPADQLGSELVLTPLAYKQRKQTYLQKRLAAG